MRQLYRPARMPAHFFDVYQWRPGRLGLYESNYIKANSPDGQRAIWIKHNILAPLDPRQPAVAEIWCALFERGRWPAARVIKQEIPMSAMSLAQDEARMEGPGVFLSPTRTQTRIAQGGRQAAWEIDITVEEAPTGAPIVHFPSARLYTLPLPRKKLLTPAPRTRWEGALIFEGERIEIEGWVGWRNHNWGTEHARTYAYGNCNLFAGRPDAIFEGFSARLRIGGGQTPFISAGVIRVYGEDMAFNSPGSLLRARAEVSFPEWRLELSSPAGRASVVQRAPVESFVGLRYRHPDGALSHCYNSKWAETTVRLRPRQGREVILSGELGELEFLFVDPIEGIALHGE